jgi:mRNA interferase MazF
LDRPLARGAVWYADLDPVRGHEQGRTRPAVIVSAATFNEGPARLVIICPVTTTERRVRSHVPIEPPEGGLRRRSFVQCEQIRAISTDRLVAPFGELSAVSMGAIEATLKNLLDL